MAKQLLDCINDPKDLRKIPLASLPELAEELRQFIINIVATKEGHLGASLGVIELTIALHYVFNTPEDKLIWDVGHQAYGHKILTGRKAKFNTNRQLGGISGFPKRSESDFDAFGTGHSSTSISAILGMAISAKLNGENRSHIAVIGDASIASGMAFEALNHLGDTDANVLLILNDNSIGIDPSVGALKNYLTQVKQGDPKEGNLFESLNLNYSGPVDGHNLELLIEELQRLQQINGPRILHVVTTKGKGLKKAEENQVIYHAPGKFDIKTGERIQKNADNLPPKFQDVFGHTLVELAKDNEKIVGITPAMPTGSSLKYMMDVMPDRAFDVGIAEQHAVTLAAGMAAEGLVPFCNIYSTFLQRAYDQVIHDVALQNLPVIFCLDRAGIVGQDGPTHHGVFDIAFLRCIPNLVLFSPINEVALRNIMFTAQLGLQNPIAIRYPRGRGSLIDWKKPFEHITVGKGKMVSKGNTIAILSFGPIGALFQEFAENSSAIGLYDMRFAKPLDTDLLDVIFTDYEHIITLEDGCKLGGFGSAILEFANSRGYTKKVKVVAFEDVFVEHGRVDELHKKHHTSIDAVKTYIANYLN